MKSSAAKRLLLIEDNHVDALTVLSCVKQFETEWDVVECQTLLEGLTALDNYSFQLILLDLGLPDSKELDALKAIVERVSAVPIIIITGSDDNAMALEALKQGAQDYIVKGSYSRESLRRSIRYAIERKNHANHLQEMAMALDSEQRSNYLQSSFLSMISHQFRTPLAIVQGSQTMLQKGVDMQDNAIIDKEMQRIASAVSRMSELIESATKLCDIESGSMRFKSVAFPFRAMLQELWSRFEGICSARELTLNIEAAPAFIVGDPYLINVALNHIINNAMRYSEANEPIRLDAFIEDSQLCITVTDSGAGIPQEELANIFERFYRIEDDNTGAHGVGIGLSLVQTIAELHKGSVSAESEEGLGTIIRLELPLQMMSCLVVDDNILNRTVAAQCLRNFGFDVAETSSPIDGLGMVRGNAANFILLDWHMPELNGLEFIHLVRDSGKDIPIFLYSAIEKGGEAFAKNNGADDFIEKPFTKEKMQAVLQRHDLLSYDVNGGGVISEPSS